MLSRFKWRPSLLLSGMIFVSSGLLAQSGTLVIKQPSANSYVSGESQMALATDLPLNTIAKVRVFLDGVMALELNGWHQELQVDLGDGLVQRSLRAEVLTADGEIVRSESLTLPALKIDFVETTRAILISAVVKDRRDQPLTNLERDRFQVFEDGLPLQIQSFNYENLPLDLIMVLDTSSSLREGIVDLKQAADTFLKQLAPADQTALFEIKNQPKLIQGFSYDRGLLASHIASMASLGQTALFDTLKQAVQLFPKQRRGRRTIILFTDGRDSVYEEPTQKAKHMRDIISAAQNKEVTLFTIGLGKRINQGALTRMAEDTGGRFLFADRPQKLPGLFQEIITDLKHQYVLGVLPVSSREGFHELRVKVKQRGSKVFARKGYTFRKE